MSKEKRKIINTLCIVLIAAYLVFFMVQMGYMGERACLFFNEYGLPTLFGAVCGVIFGALLIVLSKTLEEKNTSMRKMCKVIGILEIISALLCYAMAAITGSKI